MALRTARDRPVHDEPTQAVARQRYRCVGDLIEIDLDARSINVKLSEKEIETRLAALPPFESDNPSSWLRRYARMVTSASQGAVLI